MTDNTLTSDQISMKDIDNFATKNNLSKDGSTGWFSLDFKSVTTSRGENRTVSENFVKVGWDVGMIVFSDTIPLIGVINSLRQSTYQILKSDSNFLYLCAPEQSSTSAGGPAYLAFKKNNQILVRFS